MLLHLFVFVSPFIAMGSMDSITPESTEEVVSEGRHINLTCKYDGSILNIQWYRQQQRSRPEFLLLISEEGSIHPTLSDFSAHINQTEKRVKLQISSAAVTDSAVYYCALQPNTGGSNKIVFGSGTRLIVEPRDDYEPSYYELRDQNRTIRACLATGFSRSNATRQNELFRNHTAANTSRAVRATDGSLHSEVLLLSEDSRGKCEPDENDSGVCVDTLDKDVTVNTVSLLVVALRLLFLKTVVFNVLMTLRLWLRH